MKKLFDEAKDKNVANYVVYGDTTDNKLYDKTGEGKKQIEEAELQDAFKKGRLVIDVAGDLYAAVSVADNEATIVTVESSSLVAVVFAAKAAS